eukprot:TRINITY_DN12658_c0_g2_i1.p2 TRINITY_DN12658_c0_g2~~TRINITY_DN12658_c0_g2_i1.p2  ORF type:complete len:107 (-),score=8.13 TRINITY_DN12658_c0_g2_i1:331-651(-)
MLATEWSEPLRKGQLLESPAFDIAGVTGMRLRFYPKGHDRAKEGFCSAYAYVPGRKLVTYKLSVGGVSRTNTHAFSASDMGWDDMAPAPDVLWRILCKVMKVSAET